MHLGAKVDDTEVKAFLRSARANLRGQIAPWKAASVVYYKYVSRVFREEGDPDWAPLKPATIRRRRKGKKKNSNPIALILQDTGILRNSLTGPSKNFSYFKIYPNSMIIGTNLKYAPFHQHGKYRTPARPFFTDPTPRSVINQMRSEWMIAYARSLKN